MAHCIYLRKSRADMEAESHGEGETLERHRKALISLAKKRNLEIGAIYEEIVSGDTIASRPVMQQLLAEVEQGLWEGVLVMEVERLARGDTVDQGIVAQTFKYSATQIITPMKTYNTLNEFDEEYFEFGLFMSRREYKTINRRLQSGRKASAQEGKFIGSIAPYGYRKYKLKGDKGHSLEIIDEQAEIVRFIFDLYTVGVPDSNGDMKRLGTQAVARHLNSIGIPPIRHDYWQKETIKDIITNPTYAGMIRWGYRKQVKKMLNGKLVKSRPYTNDENCVCVEGRHEAIISPETYNLAQTFLKDNPAMPNGYKNELKSPLAGLIVCKLCGRKMVYRKAPNDKKKAYLVCHNKECKNVSAPFDLVEEKVLDILREWLASHLVATSDANQKERKKIASVEMTLDKLETQLEKLKVQLARVYEGYETGIYDSDAFVKRSRDITQKTDETNAEIKRQKDILLKLKKASKELGATLPKAQKVMELYDTLPTPQQKNELLKEVVDKIEYYKGKSAMYRGVEPDCFELDFYPKLGK
jgi:site-specific DNA recombinase